MAVLDSKAEAGHRGWAVKHTWGSCVPVLTRATCSENFTVAVWARLVMQVYFATLMNESECQVLTYKL